MKASHEGFFLLLISMVTLGVSTYLYKRSADVIGPTNTTFFYYLFSSAIAIVMWVVFREKQPIAPASLFWPALVSVFLFTSVWTFNYAIKFMDVSTASSIRSLGFIVTILLAIFISHEKLSPKDWIAVALAVIAVLILGSK
jgi:drug/metabolite transporter (DMT)-like permease